MLRASEVKLGPNTHSASPQMPQTSNVESISARPLTTFQKHISRFSYKKKREKKVTVCLSLCKSHTCRKYAQCHFSSVLCPHTHRSCFDLLCVLFNSLPWKTGGDLNERLSLPILVVWLCTSVVLIWPSWSAGPQKQ